MVNTSTPAEVSPDAEVGALVEAAETCLIVHDTPQAVGDLLEADVLVIEAGTQEVLAGVQAEGRGKLSCSTCGHGAFRWGLRALAVGRHPRESRWSMPWAEDWTSSGLRPLNEPLPGFANWPLAQQQRRRQIVAMSSLANVHAA